MPQAPDIRLTSDKCLSGRKGRKANPIQILFLTLVKTNSSFRALTSSPPLNHFLPGRTQKYSPVQRKNFPPAHFTPLPTDNKSTWALLGGERAWTIFSAGGGFRWFHILDSGAHPCTSMLIAHPCTWRYIQTGRGLHSDLDPFVSLQLLQIRDGCTAIQGLHSGIWYLDIWYVCFLSTPCHMDKSSSISHLETTGNQFALCVFFSSCVAWCWITAISML